MIYFLICAAIIAVDFVTKRWAAAVLSKLDTIPLWRNVFHLTYVENRGAAFGIFQNQRVFFIILTALILAAVAFAVLRCKNRPKILNTGLCFIVGGAVGNLIDRVWLGFVVDMFDFRLINFPVFNVADIFVCVGAALIAIYFIVFDNKETKDDECN